MVSLQKGQTVRLDKAGGAGLTRVAMGLGWDVRRARGLLRMFDGGGDIDLDASCLLFDDAARLVDEVWFQQLRSHDGSVVHSGDNRTGAGDGDDETIVVDLLRVPVAVRSLVFTVNSFRGDSFERIANAYCRLLDLGTGREIARFDLTGAGAHTGQVMAKLTRTPGGWEMQAIGDRTAGHTFHDMMGAIVATL